MFEFYRQELYGLVARLFLPGRFQVERFQALQKMFKKAAINFFQEIFTLSMQR
jgi:hypothetical protein